MQQEKLNKNPQNQDIKFGRRHDGERPSTHESQPLFVSIRSFFKIATLFWRSRESLMAWVQLGLIVLFTAMTIFLAKQFNDWYKEFWDYIQNYNLNGFIGCLFLFCFLATLHVCTVVYKAYVISALTIRWRKWLTKYYIERYLKRNAFYTLALTDAETDNPDQRIADDLNKFVALTISTIISIITDLSMLATFVIVLWGLSAAVTVPIMGHEVHLPDGYMLYLALVYATLGTIITFVMGRPLVLLNFRQQRFEADFRYALIRMRENAESVALYRGSGEEARRFKFLFGDVVSNYVYLIFKIKTLGFFTLGYAQTAVIFPIIISAPMYFAHIITIGSLMQINSAFGRVQDSLSTLIQNFTSLAEWKAVIDRLALFEKGISKAANLPLPTISTVGTNLTIKGLEVKRPDGVALLSNFDLELNPGESLLIRGASGCGKSTFLRSVAGIWPYATGEIKLPQGKSLFLSQKPYMPLGTLKAAVCYPQQADQTSDEVIAEMLKSVGLSNLVDKLGSVEQWGMALSLGEQQRIAFIRAFINAPDIIFMDEVTSALDEDNESTLYGMLKTRLPQAIIISVGHRGTLVKFHTRELKF